MNIITLIFKGIILGVVLLIPGASASTVAILMGIYDGIIISISDIFKNFKKSIQYLFPVGIGIFIGVIIASFIITRFILNYSYLIYSIFLGISLGCLPNIYQDRKLSIKDKKGIILMLISLLISILFSIIMIENNEVKEVSTMTYLFLFISGILGAIGCVIPGISGMIIVMLLGYYPLLLKAITEILVLTNFFSNFFIIISRVYCSACFCDNKTIWKFTIYNGHFAVNCFDFDFRFSY